MEYSAVIDTPPGRLGITIQDDHLASIEYLSSQVKPLTAKKGLAQEVVYQIENYFKNSAYRFDLPLCLQGTDHQQSVWQQMLLIHAGSTRTYGEIADRIHSGARAVGNSCRSNPLPIVVPCHRVVAARGIGGYEGKRSGPALDRKICLLRHEGVEI